MTLRRYHFFPYVLVVQHRIFGTNSYHCKRSLNYYQIESEFLLYMCKNLRRGEHTECIASILPKNQSSAAHVYNVCLMCSNHWTGHCVYKRQSSIRIQLSCNGHIWDVQSRRTSSWRIWGSTMLAPKNHMFLRSLVPLEATIRVNIMLESACEVRFVYCIRASELLEVDSRDFCD